MGAKPGVVRAVVDNNRPKRVLCVHRETGGGSRTRWSWEGGGVQSRRQEHARVRDTQVAHDRLKPENNARQQQPTLRHSRLYDLHRLASCALSQNMLWPCGQLI